MNPTWRYSFLVFHPHDPKPKRIHQIASNRAKTRSTRSQTCVKYRGIIIFKESALRPILSSSRDVYIFIYISVPFHLIYFKASHCPTPVTWPFPRPVIGLTIGPQFHQKIAGGPLQSSALQSPDRVQNYEEVHLQSEIACNILIKM